MFLLAALLPVLVERWVWWLCVVLRLGIEVLRRLLWRWY